MIPVKRLFATLALALAFMAGSAQAERAVVYGTLTVISDQFVVKTSQPFETEIEDGNGAPVHYRENKIQLAGYGPEEIASLRALVGKKVQIDGEIFAAHTRYHIEPLLIDLSEGDFMRLGGAAAPRAGDQVVIYGTLTVWHPSKKERANADVPGNHDHDYFLLKPARPFEAEIANWNVGHHGEFEKTALAEIQVWGAGGLDDPALKKLVGKKVEVKGELQAALTTQHITPLLIDLQDGGTLRAWKLPKASTKAAETAIFGACDQPARRFHRTGLRGNSGALYRAIRDSLDGFRCGILVRCLQRAQAAR